MSKKTGVLIVGARGSLAVTTMLGTMAVIRGYCDKTGMVTALKNFDGLNLTELEDLVFGGWDIRQESLVSIAHQIVCDTGSLNYHQFKEVEKKFSLIENDIFPGTVQNSGKAVRELVTNLLPYKGSIQQIIDLLKTDIKKFKQKHSLETVVVVNLSSTEPPLPDNKAPLTLSLLKKAIEQNQKDLIRPATLYAFAAIESDCIYINFTPSAGALLPGLIEFAINKELPVMGSDGKTGETLVKSALAPLFACRNLKVQSWQGYNMLGNLDGKVLSNPDNKSSKIKTKDKLLAKILGYKPHSKVAIDYVPSLGDNKTAWDFIHFEGFLNTKMSLQFTWQGCDSALAAPLVLDLIRLGIFARLKKEKGLMPHLACFFKSPEGVKEHSLQRQFDALLEYIAFHTLSE